MYEDVPTLAQVRPFMRVGVREPVGDGAIRAVDHSARRSEQVEEANGWDKPCGTGVEDAGNGVLVLLIA